MKPQVLARWVHRFETILLCAILAGSTCSLVRAETGVVTVTWKDQRLSMQADNVAFQRLIEVVSQHTGVLFKSFALIDEPLTVHFASLPLREGLHRLLEHANYVVLSKAMPGQEPAPSMVIILGKRPSAAGGDAAAPADETRTAWQTTLDDADPHRRWQTLQALVKMGQWTDGEMQALMYAAARDPEPLIRELAYQHLYAQGDARLHSLLIEDARSTSSDIRKTALQFLSQTSVPEALTLLSEATEDDNIDIRFTAFQQLTSLAAAGGLAVIRERLYHADPEIRIMAIEMMAAQGREQAWEAATATLNDSDELVRSKATGVMHELNSQAEGKGGQ